MSNFSSTKVSSIGKALPAAAKRPFRADIQGLRTIAVLAVIADHMLGYPSGGFVGVDVFFVISGFLITGLLLREYQKSGTISFIDFYKRRIRRIMPLAVLVLAVTMAVSWAVLSAGRSKSVFQDGLWSLVFAGNWRFALTGTDYMNADGPVSPLQHFWSLAVEEQFYILWPILILVVLGVTVEKLRMGHARATAILAVAMAVVIAGSFAFAMWETRTNPTVAYFSTFSRAWELGVGALIAACSTTLARIPGAARILLSYLGLAGIAVSLFAISATDPFPAPWAALPVVSSALVVAAGIGGTPRFMFPLTNRVSGYLGDISYSLYLWHFPIIILVGDMAPVSGWIGHVMMLVAIFLVSAASYHLIEDPIRKSAWLDPKAVGKTGRRGGSERQNRFLYVGLAFLAVVSVVVSGMALQTRTPPPAPSEAVAFLAERAQASGEPAPAEVPSNISAEIATALDATEWPDKLTPALDDLDSRNFSREDAEGCAPATPNGKDCTVPAGDMSKTAVVVGDSMAIAWLPAIRKSLEPMGWRVFSMTYAGCPLLQAETTGSDAGIVAACGGHKELVAENLAAAKPGLVIMSNNYGVTFAEEPADLMGAWGTSLSGTYSEWLAPAGKVVTLSAPPRSMDPEECATRFSKPADCIGIIPDRWATYAATDRRVAEQAGSTYLSTREWFCADDNRCPAFVGDTIVRRDATHMTADYAEKIAPLLAEALVPALS